MRFHYNSRKLIACEIADFPLSHLYTIVQKGYIDELLCHCYCYCLTLLHTHQRLRGHCALQLVI